MISPTGEKLPQYDYVSHANRQIRLCQEALLRSDFQGLLVHGESPAPIPQEDILSDFAPVAQVEGDIPLLVGCYQHGDAKALYVVNNSVEKAGCAVITFREEVQGTLLHLDDSKTFQTRQLSIFLEPGAAAMLNGLR